MGKAAIGKERVYWALRSKNLGHMGWGRHDFRGRGKLEGKVQFCSTTRERLQPKACWAALPPKIGHMGELVMSKGVGIGGPRSLRDHGS